MDKNRILYLIFSAAISILFSSCEKGSDPVHTENGTRFVLATKSAAEIGTTFRIMAYGCQEDNLFNCVASGTYSLLDGKEFGGVKYLSASELTDEGIFIKEDGTKALAVPYSELERENFYISYISPGMKHSNGGFTVDFSKAFYSSDVQTAQLHNYGIVELSGELIDRRAKIGFRIYEDAVNVTVTDFRIEGAGNTYWPATRQVTPNDALLDISSRLKEVQPNTDKLKYECNGDDMPFILSGIYAPKDTVIRCIANNKTVYGEISPKAENIKESGYLVVKFNLTVDGKTSAMEVPLTKKVPELLPLTTYMYNIKITSEYIKTILEISSMSGPNSWDDVEVGFEIKDNTITVDLGSFDYSYEWDKSDWDEIEIF